MINKLHKGINRHVLICTRTKATSRVTGVTSHRTDMVCRRWADRTVLQVSYGLWGDAAICLASWCVEGQSCMCCCVSLPVSRHEVLHTQTPRMLICIGAWPHKMALCSRFICCVCVQTDKMLCSWIFNPEKLSRDRIWNSSTDLKCMQILARRESHFQLDPSTINNLAQLSHSFLIVMKCPAQGVEL